MRQRESGTRLEILVDPMSGEALPEEADDPEED
jgi:hypothetical protein